MTYILSKACGGSESKPSQMFKLTTPMSRSLVTRFCISSRRKEQNEQESAEGVISLAWLVEKDTLLPSTREKPWSSCFDQMIGLVSWLYIFDLQSSYMESVADSLIRVANLIEGKRKSFGAFAAAADRD